MSKFLMQARSSSDGQLYSWVSATLDFAGSGFAGPGTPQEIAAVGREVVAGGGGGASVITDWKESVRSATTGNITLSGEQTIDGVWVVAGDRVLVKNQSTGAQNGIYVAAAGAWSRAADFDSGTEVTAGAGMVVEEGTTNGDTLWILTTNNPITVGTTALTFSQISGGGGLTAPANPGDDGKVAVAAGGDLVYTLLTAAHLAAAAAIAPTQLADVAGRSVLGRSAGTTGAMAAITASANQVLRESGGVLGFGAINAQSPDAIVPNFGAQNVQTTGDLSLGATPATAGNLRVTHGFSLQARNNANTANWTLLSFGVDATNRQAVGGTTHQLDLKGTDAGGVVASVAAGRRLAITSTDSLFSSDVNQPGTLIVAPGAGTVTSQQGTSGVNFRALAQHATAANGALLQIARSRGTASAPATIQNNDVVGAIDFIARDDAGWERVAQIRHVASTVSGGTINNALEFWTGVDSAGLAKRLEINSAGTIDAQGSNITTTGTLASGNLSVTGTIAASSTISGVNTLYVTNFQVAAVGAEISALKQRGASGAVDAGDTLLRLVAQARTGAATVRTAGSISFIAEQDGETGELELTAPRTRMRTDLSSGGISASFETVPYWMKTTGDGVTNIAVIPIDAGDFVRLHVFVEGSDGSGNRTWREWYLGVRRVGAGNVTEVFRTEVVPLFSDDADRTIGYTLNTTNQQVEIWVDGETATTINWTAAITQMVHAG